MATNEFTKTDLKEVSDIISGKVVSSIEDVWIDGDDFVKITFTDGTRLLIRYDWIYGYQIEDD